MLTPAKLITPPEWMTSPETERVMLALAGEASEPQALFVGGCIRNQIMGKSPGEIDIATRLTPADATSRLEQVGIKVIPTGIEHGTITAVIDKNIFEITTLRRDVETDGRHAVVAFTDDWHEDAARRDFTMNTLLADTSGNIYDPTGRGLQDLEAGRVVFVGEPSQRIAEDYLRILRFFRFHALYGTGEPDAGALTACRAASDKIETLSRERVTQEFMKIIAAPNAAAIIDLMFNNNVLSDLADKNYKTEYLGELISLQRQHNMPETVTRLAMLNREIYRFEKFLILTNSQKKTFSNIFKALESFDVNPDIKTLAYKYPDVAAQALLFDMARTNADHDMEIIKNWSPLVLPITGDDIMAAGVNAGPEVGRLLKSVESWWLENGMSPGRDACLQKMRSLL